MINSQFALGLRAVACSQLQPQHIRVAMQMLENESAKLNISNEPMDFISYFLHFLYTSPVPSIRASVLRIISNFSVNSGKYIIEQYKYDRIIAASVDQKLQENVNIDEEKLAAFKNIFVIVDFFHKFPKSIIRALVSFYETAPRSFKKLIEVTLAKGILLCDHFPNIQDVSDIIINSLLASGSDSLIGLLGFIFEKQYIRVVDCHFAEKLITPLSNFGGGINSENAENIIKIFTMLLKTWPGLLCFGIQMRGLLDLTETISKNPTILIKILSNLLLLDGPKHSVIDSYVGFLFYNLLNFNILEKLNELSNNQKNQDASKLLNYLLQYTPSYTASYEAIHRPQVIIDDSSSKPIISKLTQLTSDSYIPQTISNFVLDPDPSKWNWNIIRSYLNIVLVINDNEAQSQNAFVFYGKLFQYFGFNFLSSQTNYSITSQCLFSLVDLILSKPWGPPLIQNDQVFFNSMVIAFRSLEAKNVKEDNHPMWALIECFCKFMCDTSGMTILLKWDVFKKLDDIGEKFVQPAVVKKLLKMMRFDPQYSMSSYFYVKFLRSKNLDIVKLAMEELLNKTKTVPNFYQNCLKLILLNNIKEIYRQNNTPNKDLYINLFLNLLCRMMLNSAECRDIVLKDTELHPIIRSYSHEMYSVLLSHPNSMQLINVDEELNYWIKEGIFSYVKVYDKALKMTFSHNFETIPSIINVNGYALVPPHIFGQLGKYNAGLEKLKTKIPDLLRICASNSASRRRAAFLALGHFGSNSNAITNEIITKLIESATNKSSYLLKGTLFASLSMMKFDYDMEDLLYSKGIQIWKFGNHKCVIPIDFQSFYKTMKTKPSRSHNKSIVQLPQSNLTFSQCISNIINPITANKGKNDIISLMNEQGSNLSTIEYATFVGDILSNFTLTYDTRQYLLSLVRLVPRFPYPQVNINQRLAAEYGARVMESIAINSIPDNMVLSQIPMPVIPASMIKQQRPGAKFPEVYLNDAEFKLCMGYDRNTFYQLPEQNQTALRMNLMK